MIKKKPYEDELIKALSVIFKQRRMLLGLSQDDVADMAGINRSHISNLERRPQNISLLNLSRMAVALGSSPSKLLAHAERLIKEARRA